MKQLQEIIDNYKDYEIFLDDRFGTRFVNFLTIDQARGIFSVKEDLTPEEIVNWEQTTKEWTEENVIEQLKQDISFGHEKAVNQRGISASLMYEVCVTWCKVLEKEHLILPYTNYGISTFEALAKEFEVEL